MSSSRRGAARAHLLDRRHPIGKSECRVADRDEPGHGRRRRLAAADEVNAEKEVARNRRSPARDPAKPTSRDAEYASTRRPVLEAGSPARRPPGSVREVAARSATRLRHPVGSHTVCGRARSPTPPAATPRPRSAGRRHGPGVRPEGRRHVAEVAPPQGRRHHRRRRRGVRTGLPRARLRRALGPPARRRLAAALMASSYQGVGRRRVRTLRVADRRPRRDERGPDGSSYAQRS